MDEHGSRKELAGVLIIYLALVFGLGKYSAKLG